MENYIEQLNNRLKWFIYDCPYEDYNQQEVEYIISKLLQCQKIHEDLIESSYLRISLDSGNNQTTYK